MTHRGLPTQVLSHYQPRYCSTTNPGTVLLPTQVLSHYQPRYCPTTNPGTVPLPTQVLPHYQPRYCPTTNPGTVPLPTKGLSHYQPRYCPTHGQVAPAQRFQISNHTDHNYKLKSSSATLQILSDVTAESRMVIGQQPPFNNR